MMYKGNILKFALCAFLLVSSSSLGFAQSLPQLPESMRAAIAALIKSAAASKDPAILSEGLAALVKSNKAMALAIAGYASSNLTGSFSSGGNTRSEFVVSLAAAVASGITKSAPALAIDVAELVESNYPQAVSAIFEAIQSELASAAGGPTPTSVEALPSVGETVEQSSTESASPTG